MFNFVHGVRKLLKKNKLCSEPQMEDPGLVMLKSAFLPDLEAAHSNFTGVQTQKINP